MSTQAERISSNPVANPRFERNAARDDDLSRADVPRMDSPPGKSNEVPAKQPADPATPKRAMGGRRAFRVLGAVLAVALLSIGAYAFLTRNDESTDDAQVDADIVSIAPRVSGQIAQVLVRDNQRVKAGDVLVVIDDADLRAQLAQAEAELASARAELAAAEAQERIVQASSQGGLESARAAVTGSRSALGGAASDVARASAEVDRARAEARQAEVDLERSRQLEQAGAVSRDQLDRAVLAQQTSAAALQRAESSLASAHAARGTLASDVAAARGRLLQSAPVEAQIAAAHAATDLARAHVQQAEAATGRTRLQLSYTRVHAPTAGTISNLNAEAGRILQLGQPIANLVPDESYVVANFKETQIGRMHVGDRAVIEVDAFPSHDIEGIVESLSGGTGARFSLLPASNATGNFVKVVQRVPVRIAWVHTPRLPLKAGLSATVTVHVAERASRMVN